MIKNNYENYNEFIFNNDKILFLKKTNCCLLYLYIITLLNLLEFRVMRQLKFQIIVSLIVLVMSICFFVTDIIYNISCYQQNKIKINIKNSKKKIINIKESRRGNFDFIWLYKVIYIILPVINILMVIVNNIPKYIDFIIN